MHWRTAMNECLKKLVELDSFDLLVYIILRSNCDKQGTVSVSFGDIATMIQYHYPDIKDEAIKLTDVKLAACRLAYRGIIYKVSGGRLNRLRGLAEYTQPLKIKEPYLSIFPASEKEILGDSADLLKESEKVRLDLNRKIRSYEKILNQRISSAIPEINIYNKDGGINQRSKFFREVWAWLVLQEVDSAFITKREKDGEFVLEPDFKILATLVSRYGEWAVVDALLQTYLSKKLLTIKTESGDQWRDAVKKYLFAAIKGIGEREPKPKTEQYHGLDRKVGEVQV